MRGIGQTLSRLSAARVLLAGAAILAGATAEQAYAEPQAGSGPNGADDTALAIPRVSPGSPYGVALPQPLTPSEAARIRRIFSEQARGDIPAAIRDSAQIDASTPLGQAMLGQILADRYLGRFTRPGAAELEAWLAKWPDLPDAPAIYSLLLLRLPRGVQPPPAPPRVSSLSRADDDASPAPPVPEETEPAGDAVTRNARLDRTVLDAARGGHAERAMQAIARVRGLSPAYASLLKGEAAQILFTLNRDADAYAIGRAGAGVCDGIASGGCQQAALPAYIAGLAAWRMDRPDLARPLFETAWRAGLTTSALQAGAAYWAARAHRRTGDRAGYLLWMLRAAEQRTTFYGLLARRGLDLSVGAAPGAGETLTEADIDAVAATPEGLRAFALLQVGQTARADSELRRLWPQARNTPALGRAIMLAASRAGLVDLAAQLADLVQSADGQPRAATRFAVPRLRPAGGFIVDPAMVYALARTESNFDAGMVSSAGARGLMQIMPQTARFIVQVGGRGGVAGGLHDPAVNLDLGQRYVAYLASQDAVNGDLIRLLASYNSGPGNFSRWAANVRDDGDPLLFIEAIPIDETRNFVPRVLAYTWLYAARLQLPTPSLDELAAGEWPRYHAQDAAASPMARLH
jgi:soluble lytic murein transglycosylase